MPDVVTCVIKHDEKILLLKRSDKVSTYKNKWACVSGYVERGEDVLKRAFREIEEEIQLSKEEIQLLKKGEPIIFFDEKEGQTWRIFPFLFSSNTKKIKPDWEHTEYAWVHIEEIEKYDTVPKLKEAVYSLF
ncbi:hypothetical protein B6U81_00265 [Thermoplasmatales archaeon ex4484_30]|nr:MAG: hypothetical protein B6U81_00265 [Thermoplasmatales archaeon ex4484_30]